MPLAEINGYRLERASLLAVNGLRRLEVEIFPRDAYTRLELGLQILLPRSRNYLLRAADGRVAGFVAGVDPWLRNRTAWIITLGIGKDHQRQGLGRYLLAYCEQRLRAEIVRLTVRAGNQPAIALYESMDYVFMRRAYRYYMDGEDGLIMEKNLRSTTPPFESTRLPIA